MIEAIETQFAREAIKVEKTDGLSMEFPQWRFNLRMSTQSRWFVWNVESRGDQALMEEKTEDMPTTG